MDSNLVYLDEFGIKGINFYWDRRERYGLSESELAAVGVTDNRVKVHQDIIEPLQKVDTMFRRWGYSLYVKEGYRPEALYQLVYKKRVEKFGNKDAQRLFNMDDMPHATGLSVDATLWHLKKKEEVFLREVQDGTDALFVDFYRDKIDTTSIWYQQMQEWVIMVMQQHGFRLGKKREYFHFDFRPNEPRNYPLG